MRGSGSRDSDMELCLLIDSSYGNWETSDEEDRTGLRCGDGQERREVEVGSCLPWPGWGAQALDLGLFRSSAALQAC